MGQRVKLQTSIPNTNIVINSWEVKSSNGHDPSIRFMSSMNYLSVSAVKHMRKANYLIYTSLFNKWYLHQLYQIPEDRVVALDPGDTMEIFDSDKNEKFKVTAIFANYCAGSSMYLFEGSFGNVLYTGFFRLWPAFSIQSYPELNEIVEENKLHVAYVDNSYAAEHCNFPSRDEMIKQVTSLIRSSSNCRILISSKPFGREEVLVAIASKLDEKMDVSPQRYSVFERLSIAEHFTSQSKETRIRVLDHLLTIGECQKMLKDDKTCLVILLTAVYKFGPMKFQSKSKYPRLFIIPYSGHCNHGELKEFVRMIRPHSLLPIVLSRTQQKCSTIPRSIYELCGKVDEPSSGADEEDYGICIEKSDPVVVLPRLQVSPLRLKRVNGSYCPSSAITAAKRRSPLSPAANRACARVSHQESSKDSSQVSIKTVYSSLSLRPRPRLSSTSTSAIEPEQPLRKSTSNVTSTPQLPSTSNLLSADVPETERGQSTEKSGEVALIRSSDSSSDNPTASSSPTLRTIAAEKPHPHPIEVHAIIETVQPQSPNSNLPADESDECVVCSPFGGAPNLNDVVTPRRETDSEEELSQSEVCTVNTPVYYSPNKLVMPGTQEFAEAVTPPLRDIEYDGSLRRNRMDAMNEPELDDPNRTTASSPDNCFIREESRNVLLDSASPRASQSAKTVAYDKSLTLQLQNEDLRDMPEEYCNMLLGPKFSRICHREEQVEEMPLAHNLESESAFCENDFMIEEYVEETVPGEDVCPNREPDLPSSNPANHEDGMEADSADSSMEVVAASECQVVRDTPAIQSAAPREPQDDSSCLENSSLVRTVERILNAAISSESVYNRLVSSVRNDVISVSVTVDANHPSSISSRPVCDKRSRSEDDVTLFELDERVSGSVNVTGPTLENPTTIEGASQGDDSCVVVESSHPVNNSSHSLVRASPDGRLRGGVDESDSDDCLVVGEYMKGAETPFHVPFSRSSKRLRLDPTHRPRRNERFVNAIFFHYMKSRPQEMSDLAFDRYEFLSGCNIFSHFAYKRA